MSPRAVDDDVLLAAVADPSRRRMLDILLDRGEATATSLAAELPVTRQAIAKHLSVLERLGLVEARRQGREVRYAVRTDRLDEATEAMTRIGAAWDRRLARIKQLAEAAHARATTSGTKE
jgi:DNA-binding transcriptional ArsR family regulator